MFEWMMMVTMPIFVPLAYAKQLVVKLKCYNIIVTCSFIILYFMEGPYYHYVTFS